MEKNNTMIIIAGIVVLAVVVICGIYFIDNSGDADPNVDNVDLTGYWYAVEIETYDENGNYEKYTLEDEEVAFYNLAVYKHMDIMIRGYTVGSPIAGSVVNGAIVAVSDADHVVEGFVVNDNTLNLTIVDLDFVDGNEIVRSVTTGTYCTERSQKDVVGSVDVKGTWDCVSAVCMWSEDTYNLAKGQIKITDQNGSLFKGTMDQEVGETTVAKKIMGMFSSFKSGDYNLAFIADDSGFIWTSLIKEDGMILEAQDVSDATKNLGKLVTIERIYSKDGSMIKVDAPINLEGTSWTTERTHYIYSDYEEGTEYDGYTFTVEKQEGAMIYGKLTNNDLRYSSSYDFVGYIYGDSQIIIDVCLNMWGEYNEWGSIIMKDENSMYYVTLDPNTWYSYAYAFELNRVGVDETYDITGHWYNMRVEGINGSGKRVSTAYNSDFLDAYDLTIHGVKDNMFYGYFDGRYITGSYVDGIITIRCDVDYGYMVFTGRMVGKNTMSAVEVFYNEDTGETSVWRVTFTSEMIDYASSISESEPITAEWEWLKARSYNVENYPLQGSTVKIARYYTNVFYGTMEQTVGIEVVEKGIKGVMSQRTVDDDGNITTTGYIIDETGFIWNFIIKDDIMSLYCNIIGETAETEGKAVAVERIYRDASGDPTPVADTADPIKLEGTWKADKVYLMYEDGKTESKDASYEFNIKQDGALFCGTSSGTGHGSGTFVGYAVGNRIEIMSIYDTDNEDEDDSGYGLMSDDGSIYLVEYYELEGKYVTMICNLVKQA